MAADALPEAGRGHLDDGFGVHEFEAHRAVGVQCRTLPEIASAWDFLYRQWLPNSRYEPAEIPAVKRFARMPHQWGRDVWQVACSIAVRPRRP